MVVSAIQRIGTGSDQALEAFYLATQVRFPYLAYDDSRALAVKAIWALGKTPGDRAAEKLSALAESPDRIVRENAVKQLERRSRSS